MIKSKLMLGAAVLIAVVAGCSKNETNGITGTTQYTSVQLADDPAAFNLAVGDSLSFAPTATLEPQGVLVSNGTDNMTYAIANTAVAEINGSGYVQGVSGGTTALLITYTDVNHAFTTTTLSVPITIGPVP
ncbi:MAG: hypothetical protein ABI446_08770 [Gemmatimonadaceae bacterium]